MDAELIPLLHTWSLAVEEQFYIFFPIFLVLVWRLGKSKVFWLIIFFAITSLLLSEWGWRYSPSANFYLAPTRAWELLAGSIAAFIVHERGVKNNNSLALIGLIAILFSIFFYNESTPFPSVYTLLPVVGVVFLVLYANKETFVAKILSTRLFVGVGLISYSAYLWHQPLFAFVRRLNGVHLDIVVAWFLIGVTLLLSYISWRFVEQPFREKSFCGRRSVFVLSGVTTLLISGFAVFLVASGGASYRYSFPSKPEPWASIKCHGAKNPQPYDSFFSECLGVESESDGENIYLIGDSHAAQLTFALRYVAEMRGVRFHFINTSDKSHFPYSFWNQRVDSDDVLDYLLKVIKEGDFFVTSFHRGHLNKNRDSHIKIGSDVVVGEKALLFRENFSAYGEKFRNKNIHVYLIKDGPLLADKDTSLEACMYEYQKNKGPSCTINFEQDDATRYRQSYVFDNLANTFDFVKTLDYLPLLYEHGRFSPISKDGEYLMFDRHHLTEAASMKLVEFFDVKLRPIN